MKKILFTLILCVLLSNFGFGQSAVVTLRPSYIDISAATSESAVLMTVSSYGSDLAKHRLYNGSNQYNCWNSATNTYISSSTYADGPLVPGTPSTSSTWWILFQRGNNNSTAASYRDRLSPYTTNYRTIALTAATSITSPFNLTGAVTASGGYDLTVKYVILGFDATSGGNLLCATSSALTTGDFTLVCDGTTTIKRVEIRTTSNTILTSTTNEAGWNSNTDLNDIPLPVNLQSFNSNISGNNVKLLWKTVEEINNSGFDVERAEVRSQNLEFSKIGFVEGKGTKNTSTSYSFEDKNLQSGKYKYRLKQIDYNGNYEYFELNGEVEVGVPNKFDMSQNYPNPFNPVTKINFDLPENGLVNIRLYDMLGREVAVIVNEVRSAGYHTVQFDASKLSSGVYFYKMNAGKFSGVKKMSIIK